MSNRYQPAAAGGYLPRFLQGSGTPCAPHQTHYLIYNELGSQRSDTRGGINYFLMTYDHPAPNRPFRPYRDQYARRARNSLQSQLQANARYGSPIPPQE